MSHLIDHYRTAVSAELSRTLAAPMPFALVNEAAPSDDFLAPLRTLAIGGKRTRALFALAGFQAATGLTEPDLASNEFYSTLVSISTALELYQLSALIHDDVIDGAATRRGVPTAHVSYANAHRMHDLLGDPHAYGERMALLLGDYALSLAAYILEDSLDSYAGMARARLLFHSMTAEVAFGQYTDLHAEYVPLSNEVAAGTAVDAALSVLYHKAARYSVTVPTLIGAYAGIGVMNVSDTDASAILEELDAICRPLGEAFQMRDDALGVFGEPEVTGKPAGDDITEGKRTVLLALTRASASPSDRALIDTLLGQELSDHDLADIRRVIEESGAYAEHEAMIRSRESRCAELMHSSPRELSVLYGLAAELSGRAA